MKMRPFLTLVFACTLLTPVYGKASVAGADDHLWFSLSPAKTHAVKEHHGRGQSNSHGRHAGHESEHRPKPIRTYWLNSCSISPEAIAYMMQPEGDYTTVPIIRKEHNVSISIKTPFGDGPFHGANTLYLSDQHIENETLVLRTAKWLAIHHSCGWGHDQKFNKKRMQTLNSAEIPLDIAVDNLWDTNFHSTVMSGDTISLSVLSFGKPAVGAIVSIISDKGWKKSITTDSNGKASFQMIRDYYPKSWSLFNPKKRGKFKFMAVYETELTGKHEGATYNKARMNSTFSWRYYPAKREYSSFTYGLLVTVLFMLMSGFGIFLYRDRRSQSYRDIKFDE